ncbi:MAG: hypothetical protein ACR2Q4_01555 [Geminicoccaceae bacterium]
MFARKRFLSAAAATAAMSSDDQAPQVSTKHIVDTAEEAIGPAPDPNRRG